MRTNRYRYTEWAEKDKEPKALELYDLREDPGGDTDVAEDRRNKKLLAQLRRQSRAGR